MKERKFLFSVFQANIDVMTFEYGLLKYLGTVIIVQV